MPSRQEAKKRKVSVRKKKNNQKTTIVRSDANEIKGKTMKGGRKRMNVPTNSDSGDVDAKKKKKNEKAANEANGSECGRGDPQPQVDVVEKEEEEVEAMIEEPGAAGATEMNGGGLTMVVGTPAVVVGGFGVNGTIGAFGGAVGLPGANGGGLGAFGTLGTIGGAMGVGVDFRGIARLRDVYKATSGFTPFHTIFAVEALKEAYWVAKEAIEMCPVNGVVLDTKRFPWEVSENDAPERLAPSDNQPLTFDSISETKHESESSEDVDIETIVEESTAQQLEPNVTTEEKPIMGLPDDNVEGNQVKQSTQLTISSAVSTKPSVKNEDNCLGGPQQTDFPESRTSSDQTNDSHTRFQIFNTRLCPRDFTRVPPIEVKTALLEDLAQLGFNDVENHIQLVERPMNTMMVKNRPQYSITFTASKELENQLKMLINDKDGEKMEQFNGQRNNSSRLETSLQLALVDDVDTKCLSYNDSRITCSFLRCLSIVLSSTNRGLKTLTTPTMLKITKSDGTSTSVSMMTAFYSEWEEEAKEAVTMLTAKAQRRIQSLMNHYDSNSNRKTKHVMSKKKMC